jgi:hypothetical protein
VHGAQRHTQHSTPRRASPAMVSSTVGSSGTRLLLGRRVWPLPSKKDRNASRASAPDCGRLCGAGQQHRVCGCVGEGCRTAHCACQRGTTGQQRRLTIGGAVGALAPPAAAGCWPDCGAVVLTSVRVGMARWHERQLQPIACSCRPSHAQSRSLRCWQHSAACQAAL